MMFERFGTFLGTPDYMPPEIITSDDAGHAGYGVGCDIWSLGIVTYQMLCGAEYAPSLLSTTREYPPCPSKYYKGIPSFPSNYYKAMSVSARRPHALPVHLRRRVRRDG